MNRNPSRRQRLLINIFAFLSIVGYSILNIIGSTVKSINHAADADRSAPASPNHIHTINNIPITRNDTSIRISFSLHDPQTTPYRNIYAPSGCNFGELPKGGVRTGEIPPSLLLGIESGGGRVLDFTTTIETNLNILQIGDSVTIQIAQALDEMLGGYELQSRKVLWDAYTGADGGTLVAPTRGGGMHGAWRITGLLSEKARGQPDGKNKKGGGWNYHQVNPFLRHVYPWEGQDVTAEKIDAVIFRVMHGWMKVDEITRERIIEAAELAHSILGAGTIVFLTVPFTNNVKTVEIMEGVRKINDMIRDVARNWHLNHDTHVLVMEYGAYCNHVIWTNARHIGYNVSAPLTSNPKVFDVEGPSFLQERLKQDVFPPSIPMVCAKKPTSESGGAYCERNILFEDGMHFCTETMAARIGAGIACLLGCVYNRLGPEAGSHQEKNNLQSSLEKQLLKIRACERQCNEQFLSVMPIKESWVVDSNTNLASFSGL